MIVAGITPSEVVVIVRGVINRTIVKVEVGVTVPRTPTIRGGVPLNHSNFRLPTVAGYLNILYINLLSTFSDDMKFHPSVFDMTHCGDFNAFGAIFRSQDKSVAVASLFSVFVVVTAPCRLSLGITNPSTPGDRLFVVLNLYTMGVSSISHQNLNVLCPHWNFKKVYCTCNCKFIVICVLSSVCPGSESDPLFKAWTCGNRRTATFYPFINLICYAMLAAEPIRVVIIIRSDGA
jgi:hypothetical protein